MALTANQILAHIGIAPHNRRTAIAADFLSGGLEGLLQNVSVPSSVLNKKMHGISYHFCREAVASGICRIAKEDTRTNVADLFTKALGKPRRDELLDRFMY